MVTYDEKTRGETKSKGGGVGERKFSLKTKIDAKKAVIIRPGPGVPTRAMLLVLQPTPPPHLRQTGRDT